jgi:predicted nucleotidyltransferase
LSFSEPYNSLLNKLVEALKSHFGEKLVSVVVYGSLARGEMRRDSDIDLLIVVDTLPKSRLRRQELFEEVEALMEGDLKRLWAEGLYITFSPLMKTVEEARKLSPLYLDMVDDAVILFDREGFFKGVLDRLRKKLNELGARRVKLGRRWYWILKDRYEFGEVITIE